MKNVLQIEFSPGILDDREAILRRAGCRVMSVLGCDEAQAFDPVAHKVGVVVIGQVLCARNADNLFRSSRKAF